MKTENQAHGIFKALVYIAQSFGNKHGVGAVSHNASALISKFYTAAKGYDKTRAISVF